MSTQQIVANPTKASLFLVMTVHPGAEDAARDFLAEFSGLTRAVAFRKPAANLMAVVGIGADLWARTFAAPAPEHLHPFKEMRGATHVAPCTPGDLLIHLRAEEMDMCFEAARLMTDQLAGHAEVADEVHGFSYFDNRDLLGFVDGTENPENHRAEQVVRIPRGPYAGGSYVIVQKYTHDMAAWNALSTTEQERVIGRTKADDVELDESVKPANSHVALNDLDDIDGQAREIYRLNMPFGSLRTAEHGTYFIGYAADPTITEQMLENMFIGKPAGNYDRILDFSTAQTGGLFFCPSYELLDTIDELPPATSNTATGDTAATPDPQSPTATTSLGIGSLKK